MEAGRKINRHFRKQKNTKDGDGGEMGWQDFLNSLQSMSPNQHYHLHRDTPSYSSRQEAGEGPSDWEHAFRLPAYSNTQQRWHPRTAVVHSSEDCIHRNKSSRACFFDYSNRLQLPALDTPTTNVSSSSRDHDFSSSLSSDSTFLPRNDGCGPRSGGSDQVTPSEGLFPPPQGFQLPNQLCTITELPPSDGESSESEPISLPTPPPDYDYIRGDYNSDPRLHRSNSAGTSSSTSLLEYFHSSKGITNVTCRRLCLAVVVICVICVAALGTCGAIYAGLAAEPAHKDFTDVSDRVVDLLGSVRLTEVIYDTSLKDNSTDKYKHLENAFCSTIETSLNISFQDKGLGMGCQIITFVNGSCIAVFRVIQRKQNTAALENPQDTLKSSLIQHSAFHKFGVDPDILFTSNQCDTANPCQHGGLCEKTNQTGDRYKCLCHHRYGGRQCQEDNRLHCAADDNCHNGGSCISNLCQCLDTFEGTRCETLKDTCTTDDDCLNGGSCISNLCQCLETFEGPRCETLKETCTTDGDCLNGGSCISNLCQCLDPFEGTICETLKDTCTTDDMCHNGGSCVSNICQCLNSFSGVKCEKQAACIVNPASKCRHGGTCRSDNGGDSYRCECHAGFIGQHCEELVCSDTILCENGGTCYTNVNTGMQYCKCPLGYHGYRCGDSNPCIINRPCKNGAYCFINKSTELGYHCDCLEGFGGLDCTVDTRTTTSKMTTGETTVSVTQRVSTAVKEKPTTVTEKPTTVTEKQTTTTVTETFTTTTEKPTTTITNAKTTTSTETPKITTMTTPTTTLSEKDVCQPNPCLNSGECKLRDTNRGYKCKCLSNFEGLHCEIPITTTTTTKESTITSANQRITTTTEKTTATTTKKKKVPTATLR